MTNKMNNTSVYKIVTLIFITIVGGMFFSYSNSKKTAEEFVGSSLKYVELTEARIILGPFQEKNIVWAFQFSHHSIIDANFEIFTSLFGDLVSTNPKDLKERLTANEKLEVNPYSTK